MTIIRIYKRFLVKLRRDYPFLSPPPGYVIVFYPKFSDTVACERIKTRIARWYRIGYKVVIIWPEEEKCPYCNKGCPWNTGRPK